VTTPLVVLNEQPVSPVVPLTDPPTLSVVGSPWLTIQGEGPLAGTRAVFVRLAGCTLRCLTCDTDYTTDARDVAVESLAATVNLLMIGADRWGDVAGGDRWKILANRSVVVITGGEPMRQEALVPFVRHLTLDYGLAVQIETNGTLGLEDLPWLSDKLSVVVSPKASYIHPLIREYATAYKFVVTADKIDTARGLPTVVLGRPVKFTFDMLGDTSRRQIYVQPEDAQDDEQNAKNLKAALWVVETFGHRLSVQTHKMIGVP